MPVPNLNEFISRCVIGAIPGQVIIAFGAMYFGFLFLVAIATLSMTNDTGEVLPRYGTHVDRESYPHPEKAKGPKSWFTPQHRRSQFLALIITDKPDEISNRILMDLKRGVTAMQGKGMYTGTERSILMCALTVTEINSLKAVVAQGDPQAFVIVSPAQEILGHGFNPLNHTPAL